MSLDKLCVCCVPRGIVVAFSFSYSFAFLSLSGLCFLAKSWTRDQKCHLFRWSIFHLKFFTHFHIFLSYIIWPLLSGHHTTLCMSLKVWRASRVQQHISLIAFMHHWKIPQCDILDKRCISLNLLFWAKLQNLHIYVNIHGKYISKGHDLHNSITLCDDCLQIHHQENLKLTRIPTVKLKIPGNAFLKSESRNTFYIFHNFFMVADLLPLVDS